MKIYNDRIWMDVTCEFFFHFRDSLRLLNPFHSFCFMVKPFLLRISFLFVCLPAFVYAQPGVWQSAGAGTAASARAQAGISGDFWTLFGNPAGMASLTSAAVGTHVEQRFALKELSAAQGGIVLPFGGNQAIGAKVSWFGLGDFGEGRYGLSYAIAPLKGFRFGSSLNWYQTVIPTQGSGSSLYLDVGIQVDVSSRVTLGAFGVNVNRATLRNLGEGSPLPSLLQAGVAFKVSDQLTLLSDVVQELEGPLSVRAGFDYHPSEMLYLRMGVQTGPTAASGGIGLQVNQLRIDLASSYQPLVGFTPHLALTYAWNSTAK